MHTARRSLRSSFAWTFAGNTVHGASQWVILSLIAKLGTSEMLGQYALALAVATPVAMLSHLNLRAVLATDVNELHPFADYMSVRLVTAAAGLLVITALALLSANSQPVVLAILALGVSLSLENISDLYYAVMQRQDRLDLVSRSMIARAAVSILLVASALWTVRSIVAAAAALALGRLLTLLLYDRRCAVRPAHEHVRAPWEVFRTALPLGLVLMLISLTSNVPRYAIEHHLGTRELGAFAAVASFITVGAMIMNALGQSAITHLARSFESGNAGRFRRLTVRLAGVAAGIGVFGVLCAVVIGRPVLRIVYRPEYAAYAGLLVNVLAAGTLTYVAVMLGYAVTATRAFKVQLPLLTLVAGTSAGTSWLLVPRIGLNGAAVAIAAAALVQILGFIFILRRSI